MYLQLQDLSKTFGSTIAVQDFNLEVERGQLVSIVGPSGCGKTTTLKMVGGFLSPDSGEIKLDQKLITDDAPDNRPTATVFQSYALFPHMNVIKNITYGLKFKDYSKQEAYQQGVEMLELIGLAEYETKSIDQLSGGEQQRVALARSLIMNPKLLLLDEPLSNLDAKLKIRMRKEIKELQRRLEITMLYVTHDQEEALSISDKIVVMNQGHIEQVGTPQDVYHEPNNLFVAQFIGRINVINQQQDRYLIRPEDVVIADNKEGLSGKVVQKQFKGSFTTYFVTVENQTIEVDLFNQNDQQWQVGEHVELLCPASKRIKL
ncbi:MAG: ABC transporter ATP-binding protein [Bacillota bacterium]